MIAQLIATSALALSGLILWQVTNKNTSEVPTPSSKADLIQSQGHSQESNDTKTILALTVVLQKTLDLLAAERTERAEVTAKTLESLIVEQNRKTSETPLEDVTNRRF